jgi:hypothetical protein
MPKYYYFPEAFLGFLIALAIEVLERKCCDEIMLANRELIIFTDAFTNGDLETHSL